MGKESILNTGNCVLNIALLLFFQLLALLGGESKTQIVFCFKTIFKHVDTHIGASLW